MENYEELKKNVNLLLVDDDVDYVQVTAFFLKSKGYNIDVATSGVEAIDKVKSGMVDIVLLDYYMPELTGEDVVAKVREFNNKVIIILQTGFAGQQPPEETLRRLNVQNYHDKSDGVEKLLLQVMSAVRIFEQQNQMALADYRTKAIGRMIKGVAEALKSPILSIGAGIEATKTLIENDQQGKKQNTELLNKLEGLYLNNKQCLDKIDKILTSIIGQSDTKYNVTSMLFKDVLYILELMAKQDCIENSVELVVINSMQDTEYIHGNIDDVLFIVDEIIHMISIASNPSDKIELEFKSSKDAWYVTIGGVGVNNVDKTSNYLVKNVIKSLKDISIEEISSKYIMKIKK